MLPGNNEVYVTIAGDAEQLAASLNQVTQNATQADTAIAGLNAAIAESGGMSQEALGQIGKASIDVFRNGVQMAVTTLQTLQAQLGQISQAEAKVALSGLGFDAATTKAAIKDFQDLGNTFTDTSAKKDTFKVNVGALGDMMRYVRLTAFLVFMVALNDIRKAFQDAIKDATDFSNAIFNLDVAVRAWQRSGFDVSLQQVRDQIANIQKLYPYFNMTDMDTAMAKLINGTREFGITAQQAFQLYGDSAKIATMNNISLEEAVTKVLQAVESGRLQSLRTLGVPASVQLELEYQQKLSGIVDDTTSKLTVQQKSAAALALIHDYLSKTTDDVSKKQETLAGKTNELNTAWTNLLTRLGTAATPLLINFKSGLEGLIQAYQLWLYVIVYTGNTAMNYFEMIGAGIRHLRETGTVDLKALQEAFVKNQEEIKKTAFAAAFEQPKDILGNAPIGPSTDLSNVNQDNVKAMQKAAESIQKINEDLLNNLNKLWENYYEDLAKITLDGERKQADLIESYNQKIAQLTIDLQNSIAKENRSYYDSLLAEEVSAAQKVADARQKHQQQVIDDERKYQEALAKLRFELENNLEDAIAARDARQITRLIRTEQANEQSLKIQYENEKKSRDEKFQQELKDLAKQEADRKKALEVQHQNRLREIYIQNQQEQQAALVDLQQKEADLNKNLEQQRADRLKKYEQDKADLLLATGKLVADLTTSLNNTYNLTASGLQQLYALYDSYYGPNGSLLTMMYSFYAAIAAIGSSWGSTDQTLTEDRGTKGKRASGGIDIANKATDVTFGEAGPEMAIFIPLNGSRMSNISSVGSNVAMNGGSSGSRVAIELRLSPDLQARMVNQAQAGIVDVFMKELA